MLSCFLKNFNRCFLEENEVLNNFLYENVKNFSTSNIVSDKKTPFLHDLLFNSSIMIKFSEEQQVQFWDFILEKFQEYFSQKENKDISYSLEKYLDLDYLKTFFIHEFTKEFDMNEERNIIKVLKIIIENDKFQKDVSKDNNKDKLFFFRFLLDPRINFQKIEFMLDLFYKYINGEEKFPYDQHHTIIAYFMARDFLVDLFLFFVRYPINIKEIAIRILRTLCLNFTGYINHTSQARKQVIVEMIDNYFLKEYNFFEKCQNEENQNKELKNEEIKNDKIKNEDIQKEEIKNEEIKNEEIQNEEIKNEEIKNEEIQNEEIKNEEDEINTNSKISKPIIQNEKPIKLKMNLDDNSLFLIIDIFHLTFRCIIHEWTYDNLYFEYEQKENIDLKKVLSIIEKSFRDLCNLIQKGNEIAHKIFLQNNFLKIFGKIYYDNFHLMKNNNSELNQITELIDKEGKKVISKLNEDIISSERFLPFKYIAYLMIYNYKLYSNNINQIQNDENENEKEAKIKKYTEESFSFFSYFFEKVKNVDKIISYGNETNSNFQKLLNTANIQNYNYLIDDRIFTLSLNQTNKLSEYIKRRDDSFYLQICDILKKGVETYKYLFYYSIFLVHEGYIKKSFMKINEYFVLFLSIVICDIQHKFENEKEYTDNLEKVYDYFFINFFIFYYSDSIRQKDYVKIFANILRIAKLIRELYLSKSLFKTYIHKEAKIYKTFQKFKIIELDTNQDNPNKNYNFTLKELERIFSQSDDDINSNLKSKLEEQKNFYLKIIEELYEKDYHNEIPSFNIEDKIQKDYNERKNNFKEEYLDEKNKNDYIDSYDNYKIYRKFKKTIFSFNQPYSDFNIFYTEEGKKKLKYKISNHITKNFVHPLIVPVIDINHYLPKEFHSDLFRDNCENIYKVNLHSFKNEQKLDFINSKYLNCCLVKATHHILGFMLINQDKLEFFGKTFKNPEINRENDPHYNSNQNKCFGNLIESYHENEDYYLTIRFINIRYAYLRKYYYSNLGVEIYTFNNKNYFFVFQKEGLSQQLVSTINKPLLLKEDIYNKWYFQNQLSTFDFLIYLNILGNRSFRDITQYPVFPWIIPESGITISLQNINNNNVHKSNNSMKLIISNLKNMRDLNKPMGLIDTDNKSNLRKESYINNYQSMILDISTIKTFKYEDDSLYYSNKVLLWDKIPYCFGSHYNNQVYVSHYLTRIFPFTLTALGIEKWQFDLPERLFYNLENSYNNSIKEKNDVKELIPEFFFFPDMFLNINNLNLGYIISDIDRSEINVNDVVLPNWSKNRSDIVIYVFREFLEMISKDNIYNWVKLIFGENQFGNEAGIVNNIFLPYSYDYWGEKKIKSCSPDENINEVKALYELGICPTQIFKPNNKKKKTSKKKNVIEEKEKENELDIETCQVEYKKYVYNDNMNDIYHLMFNPANQNLQFVKKSQIIEKDTNNNGIVQQPINYSNQKITSYKKLLCGQIRDKYIITGFYDGLVYIFGQNNYSEEIRMNNSNITSRDMSMITALEINKKENEIYLGTKKGGIIVYRYSTKEKKKDSNIIFHKMIHYNFKRINYINTNEQLKMFISCSEDGFINLYLSTSCELVGSVYNEIKSDYIFLFSSPLPSFCIYSNADSKFICYSINGREINLKEFEEKHEIEEVEKEKIFSPTVITNKFRDYLVYVNNKKEIVIRKSPYMDNIRNISIKNDYLLFSSIREINNNICVVVANNESIEIYKLIPKVI